MVREPFGVNLNGLGLVLNALDDLEDDWGGETKWVVGTNVHYSVYVEFGTSSMQAQPYLRPAVEQTMREADRIAEESSGTEELVAKLALEIERRAKKLAPVDTGNLKASIRAERIQ